MNFYHTSASTLRPLVGLSLVFMLFLSSCFAPISSIDLRNPKENVVSQSIEKLNEEIGHHTVTVRMKDGKEFLAGGTQVSIDSTVCELVYEHQKVIIPTDSISEIARSYLNLATLPKPTVIGALAGLIYTAVFHPTYHDDSGFEQRASIPQGLLVGGSMGFTIGLLFSGGTVYELNADSSLQSQDVTNATRAATAPNTANNDVELKNQDE
jgi:hypothetical protein